MKRIILLSSIAMILSFNLLYSQDLTKDIIGKISIDSLIYTVRELSGEKRVFINGNDTIINKRKFNSYVNDLASQYIYDKGIQYQYKVYRQTCSESCTNIIWESKETLDSNKVIILGAHYDSENFDDKNGQSCR